MAKCLLHKHSTQVKISRTGTKLELQPMCPCFHSLLQLRRKVETRESLETCGPAVLRSAVVDEKDPVSKGEVGADI